MGALKGNFSGLLAELTGVTKVEAKSPKAVTTAPSKPAKPAIAEITDAQLPMILKAFELSHLTDALEAEKLNALRLRSLGIQVVRQAEKEPGWWLNRNFPEWAPKLGLVTLGDRASFFALLRALGETDRGFALWFRGAVGS